MKKIIKLLTCFLLAIIAIFVTNINVFATSSNEYEEKIYCELNLDDDFETNCVLVMMDKYISVVNKVYDYSFFNCNNIISIEDLTYKENSNVNIYETDFRQILKLNLNTNSKEEVIDVINILESVQGIVCVTPNYLGNKGEVINDSDYGRQWGLNGTNGINIEPAWDFTIGTREVQVGILDTGITPHEDLNDNLVNGFSYIDSTTNDSERHGSHVAGIVGAVGNNIGGSGVCRRISLVPLKFNGVIADIVSALDDAEEQGIEIVNMSWWNFPNTAILENAINSYDGLFVCIAGNAGVNIDSAPNYPASYNLPNMITVGSISQDGSRSLFSNFGANSVDIFAPGDNIYSTIPTNTYIELSGTSMAAPHVAGVAALLLSLDSSLTTQQLRTAIIESVDIPNVDGSNPLENLCVTNGRLNAYNAVKYVLEHFTNTTYTLNNYSGTVNTNKTITSEASYFNELNGFYKLNVTYAKNYEFISSSTSGIKVTLYDEDFNEVSYSNLDSTNSKVRFIQNLSVGTYYLRTQYINEESTGTINTKIISRNTAYLSTGENDILINTYNNNDEYNFINTYGPGFYKFTIEATKSNGSTVTYLPEVLTIYDSDNNVQEVKYNILGYSQDAETLKDTNYMYMYLERNGYYYIHVNMPDALYSSVILNIESISVEEIEVINRYDEVFTETLINSNNMTEYAMGFSIDQTSVFNFNVTTSEPYTGNITFILFRKAYNTDTKVYYIDELIGDYLPLDNDKKRQTLVEGTYYIGVFGNTSNVPLTVTINRLVTTSEITDQILVMDPSYSLPYGTEVRHNDGVLGGTTITEGFTRHIHFQDVTGVPSISRYDYDFYSSNTTYATVSEFGTVFAKSVTGNKTVTIIAVYKYNPSIIFTKELTIIDDISSDEKVIETNQTIHLSDFVNGLYQVTLDETNSAYPWFQYYNWSVYCPCQENDIIVTMDLYGRITTTGAGSATLTGTYTVNPNVTVIINLSIQP